MDLEARAVGAIGCENPLPWMYRKGLVGFGVWGLGLRSSGEFSGLNKASGYNTELILDTTQNSFWTLDPEAEPLYPSPEITHPTPCTLHLLHP